MKKNAKFAVLIVVVLGTLAWIGTSAVQGNQTYYKTVAELGQLDDAGKSKHLRVGGDIVQGSIQRKGAERVDFTLVQDKQMLRVAYVGEDPLPDTFRDGAQALAEGSLGNDGVFRANHVQAKCSSKYATKPGQAPAGLKTATAKQASL